MNHVTRTKLFKQGAKIADVRGTMQALAESEWMDRDYIRRRIAELESKLSQVQSELHEIEWSKDTD